MTFPELALLSCIVLLVAIFVTILSFLVSLLRPWLQCFLSGASVPLFQILAMRLRGTPVKKICEQRIRAAFVGADLSAEQLEKTYKQGVDIEKIVDALCLAKRN